MNTFENTPYTPLLNRYSAAPSGFEDHWYTYYYEIATVASGIVDQFPLPIGKEADFYWRGVYGIYPARQFNILLWGPDGNKMALTDQPCENVIGQTGMPGFFYPEVMCLAGSTPKITIIENLGGAGLTFKLALIGVQRFKV